MSPRHLIAACALLACITLQSSAQAATLRAPAPSSPAHEAQVEGVPAFVWSPVRGAVRYEYQVAADPGFGSVVLGAGFGRGTAMTANTAATLTSTLQDGEYHWRVRAIDKDDRAGRWSNPRRFTKSWSTVPQLISPTDDTAVTWPASPLVLRWSAVPLAARYIVSIATDPSMSSPVLGTSARPQTTQGTTFALPTSLANGQRYYWAITPQDADGHPGARSRVGTFTWRWPSATATQLTDLDPRAGVFDPRFSWDAVPGAASYEVEVNHTEDFSPSGQVCCTDKAIGTSLTPARVLPNNDGTAGFGYYWRVRAFDAQGNAGQWNKGPDFKKVFDDLTPSIPNLRIVDNLDQPVAGGDSTDSPVVRWDPVPGASSYEVQVAPSTGGSSCNWTGKVVDDVTASTAWTYLSTNPPIQEPGQASWPAPVFQSTVPPTSGMLAGQSYCVRVLARSDRDHKNGDVVSAFTQRAPAFTYQPPADYGVDAAPPLAIPAGNYLAPQGGTLTPSTPLLRWQRVPGARRYFVVIARDSNFTQVIDVAFTENPAYAPRLRVQPAVPLADESTSYFWVVMPASAADGGGVDATVSENSPRSFEKRSFPPQAIAPAQGAVVGAQPAFQWTPAEGARRYRLQVSQDPTFASDSLIDDLTTAGTGYTSATTYPADSVIYWRVQALDENLQGQSWSCAAPISDRCPSGAAPSSFQRVLPVPSPLQGNPTAGFEIPLLAWSPVPGAISYNLHADWVDGRESDITVSSTAFTPTTFYGNGIWRWKVKANFPSSQGPPVAGGYFPAQDFVRRMDRTPNVRGTKTRDRVLLQWDPDPAAVAYRVEIARSSGFGSAVDRAETKATAFAPDLSRRLYADGGTLYWRVASVDDGKNLGAWTTGTFVFPRALRVSISGYARKGTSTRVRIVVRDADRRPVRGARVRVTGKGLRSATRRTDADGIARFSVLPRRLAKLTFAVSRKGYRDAATTLQVR